MCTVHFRPLPDGRGSVFISYKQRRDHQGAGDNGSRSSPLMNPEDML
jgi:hypothetical protein